MADQIVDQIKERIQNQKYFVARAFAHLSEFSGIPVELLAHCFAAVIALTLLLTDDAHVLANSMLITYPLIVMLIFTEECPPQDDLIIYWFGLVTMTFCDSKLEKIPGYYLVKIAILSSLFLDPFSELAEPLRKIVRDMKTKINSKEVPNQQKKEEQPILPKTNVSERSALCSARSPGSSVILPVDTEGCNEARWTAVDRHRHSENSIDDRP